MFIVKNTNLSGILGALLLSLSISVQAEEDIEEVVVTGSYIKGSAEDASSPISVIDREDMNMSGNPSILEMIRNLGPSSGIDGETNQFQSNGLEGSSNINLRGLGPARTLVMLNGKRMVVSPFAAAETGQLFVNTNIIPAIALQRMELLKDGASATYGSDAVAGVTNFITRSDFRGLEVMGSFKDIQESDGDYDFGLIMGFGSDTTDVVVSAGIQHKSKLAFRDLDWAIDSTPATNPRGGFSGIPNPSRFLSLNSFSLINDPDCETVGGHITPAGACNFRFSDFDNIAEEEDHYQVMAEVTHQLSDTTEFHFEVLYANDDVPEWNTSPSYPPQSLFSTDRYVGPGIPSFDDFITRNPSLAAELSSGALVLGRTFGVSGPAQEGTREYNTFHISAALSGEFSSGTTWDTSLTIGQSVAERVTNDTRIDRLAYAYRGLGGPNCDIDLGTPGSGNLGTGDCFYYNPFTSGYTTSHSATADGVTGPGSSDPSLLNTPEMYDWLVQGVGSEITSDLLVFDAVLSGLSGVQAAGGEVGWAAGIQWRTENYEVDPNTVTDVTQTPCAFGIQPGETFVRGADGASLPFSYTCTGTGAFHFLAAATPYELDRDIAAVFGELNVPLFEDVEIQLAIRFEDYVGRVGPTMDPKVAVRWDVADGVTLRGSVGSSFRGPSLNQLAGRNTTLQFVAPTNAFKAVDTTGNPDLAPETAITMNFGIVLQPVDNLFATLDWWQFDFQKPIVVEPAGDIVAASISGTPEQQAAAADKITYQDPGSPSPSTIQRIDVTYQNGPDVGTDGFDYYVAYDIPTSDLGTFTIGTQGTYIRSYKVDGWLWASSFEADGLLNRFTYVRPLPDLKNNLFVNWEMGAHNLRLEHYWTSSYDDADQPTGQDWSIDSHSTFDLNYNLSLQNDQARVFASIVNLTDEDPPFARLDLSYDPYTHNPYGRTIKIGFQYNFNMQ